MASERQQIRKAIKTWIGGAVTSFKAGYAYETKDAAGHSPLYTVHSDGTTPYEDRDQHRHAFIVSLLVKRTGDGSAAEDEIDDLSERVMRLLMSGGSGILSSIRIDEAFSAQNFSNMDYPLIDGVQYRRERIRVIV